MAYPSVQPIIHSLKHMDYLSIKAHKPYAVSLTSSEDSVINSHCKTFQVRGVPHTL